MNFPLLPARTRSRPVDGVACDVRTHRGEWSEHVFFPLQNRGAAAGLASVNTQPLTCSAWTGLLATCVERHRPTSSPLAPHDGHAASRSPSRRAAVRRERGDGRRRLRAAVARPRSRRSSSTSKRGRLLPAITSRRSSGRRSTCGAPASPSTRSRSREAGGAGRAQRGRREGEGARGRRLRATATGERGTPRQDRARTVGAAQPRGRGPRDRAHDRASAATSTPNLVVKAEQLLFEVSQRGTGGELVPLSESMVRMFERVSHLYEQGATVTGLASGYPDLDRSRPASSPAT